MGYVTVTESVGEIMKTYHFSSYDDFKDWENKISGVVVSAPELHIGGDIWIKNSDRRMPVYPYGTVVEVKFRNGETASGPVASWFWTSTGQEDDIVEYRVVSK